MDYAKRYFQEVKAIADSIDGNDLQLESVLFSGTRWYEIDTEDDFKHAVDLFAS